LFYLFATLETEGDLTFFQAVYCYTPDGRGPCYAVEGEKKMLQWFRNYLVIVAKDTKTVARASTAVSASSTK
jgi:hypothetical protein